MFDVKLDDKYAPLPRIALSDDASAVPLDNFTADRQAYSCSLVLAPSMQALKDAEDPIRILLIETNAVVFHGNLIDLIARGIIPIGMDKIAGDLHNRRLSFFTKFQRIAQQVLQELTHMHRIGINGCQLIYLNTTA